ncbi:precorrin-3B C(17)-methyltransferase [Devosia rhizoryzae]|uniref:Precorrin-3B C(17)-methyltransferase n=1 Tax=Devosia rhizoryzae TaxID=2774137 RepID=A0ABX7C5J9_9HYPH|nr:precorrin-3B C(17)-methyltransferase [Devosia rhizoryzae]QQR38022.1 precorrin-3B C(17)-methyltransferase [Devosia rhizoryzae]
MSGRLVVLGTGPGKPEQMTPEAAAAIAEAEVFFGYGPYLGRLSLRPEQRIVASDNREEIDRSRAALEAAAGGARVCVVSGGDPGVFAMAAAVCEAIEDGPATWRALDVQVLPGVTAMLAVAARAGAPLGHDFCAISLSDNLKPWELIERRLRAVAEAGLVIALYNPISKARPWQLPAAFRVLREVLPVSVPVIFGRAIGRVDERFAVVPLAEAEQHRADMATCVIVGSAETRTIERPGRDPLIYSPRSARG